MQRSTSFRPAASLVFLHALPPGLARTFMQKAAQKLVCAAFFVMNGTGRIPRISLPQNR
ncbi:MAG: hypothetical protein LAT75_07670 [Candidatus Cyclonatronum sp.]|uniref:hypothetical protein n=1 Tax=Cyclonatronum sp. TaxID=3024185 RepID=UPI0025BDBAF5|nr:hypothetical protein [Cyclonatronum sp.]MCC5933337.1 hypothetical protein [Balneolales bacterium]MCH8486729.1 hypothetical protein [Cyclonatronum sp.]